MTSSPILILGGAGKTGRRVATQLHARGVGFKLASRSSKPRFDWHDDATWASTVRGTDTAYLAPPVDPVGLDAEAEDLGLHGAAERTSRPEAAPAAARLGAADERPPRTTPRRRLDAFSGLLRDRPHL